MNGHGVMSMPHHWTFRAMAAMISATVMDLPENGSPVSACRQPNSHQPGIIQSAVWVDAMALVVDHRSNLTASTFACRSFCSFVTSRTGSSVVCPFPVGGVLAAGAVGRVATLHFSTSASISASSSCPVSRILSPRTPL